MAIWQVEFSKQAYKTYQKLNKGYQRKIDRVLTWLINKEKVDIKSVEGEDDIYRLRIGKYRVLIKFQKDEKVILVTKIGLRGDIYKK
ncbi:MAG: type II toxin-antitoxin system RelE/ParE family toxin [Deltaproteobacteria bacterium]|nr:type II toxin-antitoxin system RelE/ParE family toxin [Deltaproteobacteria bacterium]